MTECTRTPASCDRRPTVAVLGAGIAGLTAAHELAERGFVVTVYESRPDERNGLGRESSRVYPPIKLGGLAASQYSTVGTRDGSPAELRPFPGRRGTPRHPGGAVAGEHGFRFFPAFYLHIWDLFQRIPVYQPTQTAGGTPSWTPTSRTIYDNVRRVVTKGITVDGEPSLVFPSELPRSPAEFVAILGQLGTLGFTPSDIATYQARLVRYLVTSPLRRGRELQNMSAYDFLVGHDSRTGTSQFSYSPRCAELLRQMPRVLVALDSQWGDARTNMSTYLQLYLNMDRRDNKADGVLNGPTTEAWFDNWYRHLLALGVRFVRGAAHCLDPPAFDPSQPPHLRPRVQFTLADGTQVAPDYTVVAVDAPGAEHLTSSLRAAGTGGTVAGLDGFATSAPPPDGPLQPQTTRPSTRRDPYAMDQTGRLPWDRFQTLTGIQYYFDTEFQLLRGHMLLTGTEWALSSINQTGMWERKPILDRDGHTSVLSVDIADFNAPSNHLVDESGQGKAARDCTADEIAAEVWRQIVHALTSQEGTVAEEILPWPVWYALDRGLTTAAGPGRQGEGRVIRNETPYLVPIVGDWNNRPSSEPWNPHGTSLSITPTEDRWVKELEQQDVWQARHGGYQVHNNSVVFAGTWNKTFTRVTSMESACESGRHAVNAILDHYIWVESGGLDRRAETTLGWKFPYGFLDQGLSSPIRLPTPAGDYCYVFDIENREPADTRALRTLDSRYCLHSLPHPLDPPTALAFGASTSPVSPLAGGHQMSAPLPDYNQMLAYIQIWRDILDKATTTTAGLAASMPLTPPGMPFMPGMPGMPGMPPMPPMPPGMPGAPGMPPMPSAASVAPPAPADYTQQLFGYLQAWRQYLEQMAGATPGPSQPSTTTSPSSTDGSGNQYPPTHPPPIYTPPPDPNGSKGRNQTSAATNASEMSILPHDEGATASVVGQSEKWPPDGVISMNYEGGSFVNEMYGNRLGRGNVAQSPGDSTAQSRGETHDGTQVFKLPRYDWGNQWVPVGFEYDPDKPAASRAAPARRGSTPAPARPADASPSQRVTRRVTPAATRQITPNSAFKGIRQTPNE